MSLYDDFEREYNNVFDENDRVKLCGRDECIKLVSLAKEIEPDKEFGNASNGMMKVHNIVELHNRLNKGQ